MNAAPRVPPRTRPRDVEVRRSDSSCGRGACGYFALARDGLQAVLRAAQLLERALELLEARALSLHYIWPRLREEVLVAKLLARALEIRQQLVGFTGEPRALLVEVDETL